jgi:mono/diheme cytochrome c family protein
VWGSATLIPVLAEQQVLATAAGAIGGIVVAILIVGFVIAVISNMRRGRAEVGAELELAANRKPYLSDEELEGPKLDRTLGLALVLLIVIAIGLPLYWLAEPGREEGEVQHYDKVFIARGEDVYLNKAKCVSCHGPNGVGGAAPYTLLNANGDYVAAVKWLAPALNTVLFRYSEAEVNNILEYGRPPSPMPAWGSLGGGPLSDQQLLDVIAYLRSIQLPANTANANLNQEIAKVCKPDANNNCTLYGTPVNTQWKTLGEALFNLGEYDAFASGAWSCARCHTRGWSIGMAQVPGGGGGLGPNLTNGSEERQFDTAAEQQAFVALGSIPGKGYGNGGIGSGQMPAWGINPNGSDPTQATMSPAQVMYTDQQIAAIVAYERSL